MTRIMKYIGILAALVLIIACFLPWVFISSKNITITGVDPSGTNFGKPAYLHLALVLFFLAFTLTPRLWAKRANLLIIALNLGWAIRNFTIISRCEAGECPVRKVGLILAFVASIVITISALFPDMKLNEEK
jgi:hypothetical protein